MSASWGNMLNNPSIYFQDNMHRFDPSQRRTLEMRYGPGSNDFSQLLELIRGWRESSGWRESNGQNIAQQTGNVFPRHILPAGSGFFEQLGLGGSQTGNVFPRHILPSGSGFLEHLGIGGGQPSPVTPWGGGNGPRTLSPRPDVIEQFRAIAERARAARESAPPNRAQPFGPDGRGWSPQVPY